MRSIHRLLAILGVWAAFAVATSMVLATAFLNHLSGGTILIICTIFALAAVMATGFIVRAAPHEQRR